MNDSLSEAIKEAYATCPASMVVYHTLEIRQPTVQGAIFLVQSRTNLTALDEDGNERTFEPVGFQFALPPSNEEGFKSLNIAIDYVGRRVKDFIRIAKSSKIAVEVVYRPYLSSDLTAPQMDPPLVLYLKDVSVVQGQVTGRATFMDLVNKLFPYEKYNRQRFPALG